MWLIPVEAFIENYRFDLSSDQAVNRTRCKKCGASVRAVGQIIYLVISEFDMSRSRTAQDGTQGRD